MKIALSTQLIIQTNQIKNCNVKKTRNSIGLTAIIFKAHLMKRILIIKKMINTRLLVELNQEYYNIERRNGDINIHMDSKLN